MAVLLLRLSGPMQSWGTQSRFSNRDTDLEPSKSGVIGLLCAAMGKSREDQSSVEQLSRLKMGIRIDLPGTMARDYHTASKVVTADGGNKACELSNRFYLADACFLVALLGELRLLEILYSALASPVWPLYLGRKAFVPGSPIFLPDGLLRDCTDLLSGLTNYPYLPPKPAEPEPLRVEIEVKFGQGSRAKLDHPISFASDKRKFGLRYMSNKFTNPEDLPTATKEKPCIYLV